MRHNILVELLMLFSACIAKAAACRYEFAEETRIAGVCSATPFAGYINTSIPQSLSAALTTTTIESANALLLFGACYLIQNDFKHDSVSK